MGPTVNGERGSPESRRLARKIRGYFADLRCRGIQRIAHCEIVETYFVLGHVHHHGNTKKSEMLRSTAEK